MSVDQLHGEKDEIGFGVQADIRDIFTDNSLDPVYQTKARILNDALQEIGMGKYQVSHRAACGPHLPLLILVSEVVPVPCSWFWLAVVSYQMIRR